MGVYDQLVVHYSRVLAKKGAVEVPNHKVLARFVAKLKSDGVEFKVTQAQTGSWRSFTQGCCCCMTIHYGAAIDSGYVNLGIR